MQVFYSLSCTCILLQCFLKENSLPANDFGGVLIKLLFYTWGGRLQDSIYVSKVGSMVGLYISQCPILQSFKPNWDSSQELLDLSKLGVPKDHQSLLIFMSHGYSLSWVATKTY